MKVSVTRKNIIFLLYLAHENIDFNLKRMQKRNVFLSHSGLCVF